MQTLELKDNEARRIIAQELDTNLLVEAGAGSGKTEEMSKRILALISSGRRRIGEIVAITFTRKAANELRERIRRTLEKEYKDTENELYKDALDYIHECFIGTIHSFCAKMLRERPIEAGIDPGFEEIDEAVDSAIRNEIWETYVMEADEDDKVILRLMDDFNVNEGSAKQLLQAVCEHQDVTFDIPNDDETTLNDVFKQVRDVLKMLYSTISENYDVIPEGVLKGLARADSLQKSMMTFRRKTLGTKSDAQSNKALIDLIMVFSTSSSVGVVQKCWGDSKVEKENAKALGERFKDLRESFIMPVINSISVTVYNNLLIPFAMKAKNTYMQHKRTVSQLDFQDLLMMTSRLLRDFPEVRTYFRNKYKTLLIDEFQDTDPIQTEIVMYLTGLETEEKVWHRITPGVGSLFVVGDPKQSIYGFRRADFRLYKRFREHMINSGGKVVELQTNFRSTDDLGFWYDEAFPKLLDGEEQAVFTKMDTVLPASAGTLSGVAYYRIDESTNARILAAEADVLTSIISCLVASGEITERKKDDSGWYCFTNRPVQYKDIMVLSRKKSPLEQIANNVAASGIPVRITGADITRRTSEFISFAELITMLAYPEENAYVYNVMRGDFFRFTNRDIYRYKRRGGELRIYFDFDVFYEKNPLNEGIKAIFDNVRDCFAKLRRFSDYIQNLSPAAATERIIEELGLIRVHLTSGEKLAGLSSFVSLIEKIRLKKISDVWGLNLFIGELEAMIVNGFEEDIDVEGKDVDAVRFMNVHKAKGLEAPIVILCAPCSGKMPEPRFYTEQVAHETGLDETFGYIRIDKNPDFPFIKKYYEPPGWKDIEQKALLKESLEQDRLLYVAATRARNLLIISDSAGRDNPWGKLVGLLPAGKVDILEKVCRMEKADDVEDRDGRLVGETEVVGAVGVTVAVSEIGAIPPASGERLSAFGESQSASGGATPAPGERFETELEDVKARRDKVFADNRPTYRMVAPSHDTKSAKTSDSAIDPDEAGAAESAVGVDMAAVVADAGIVDDVDNAIAVNTMEVVIYGEETTIKDGKLTIGVIVHKVLETLITDEPALPEMIDLILDDSGDGYITEELLMSIADEFKKSLLWERLQKAQKVYTEVPFSYKAPASSRFSGEDAEQDTYVNGFVDLVFKDETGWVIVDYKTYDGHEIAHDIRKGYEKQLESYKEVWEKITGEPVIETEIFFVRKRIIDSDPLR